LYWIRSHIGISGNEEAVCCLPLSLSAGHFKACSSHPRRVVGNNSVTHLSHRDAVIIRLRIGHTRVTYKYLLTDDSQPLCDECKSSLTVKHILQECYRLKNVCKNYFTCSSFKELCESVDHGFYQRSQFLSSCLVIIVFVSILHQLLDPSCYLVFYIIRFYHLLYCVTYNLSITSFSQHPTSVALHSLIDCCIFIWDECSSQMNGNRPQRSHRSKFSIIVTLKNIGTHSSLFNNDDVLYIILTYYLLTTFHNKFYNTHMPRTSGYHLQNI